MNGGNYGLAFVLVRGGVLHIIIVMMVEAGLPLLLPD
jgi:hypothetical protein